jgi:hypothetical protein
MPEWKRSMREPSNGTADLKKELPNVAEQAVKK